MVNRKRFGRSGKSPRSGSCEAKRSVRFATVSRVFNGYDDVSAATRERVLAVASKLDTPRGPPPGRW